MKTCKGCKHYKQYEKTNIITCEFLGETNYCEKDKEEFAITELEKIKSEINEAFYSMTYSYESGFSICLDIIDKHITELKGE